MDTESILKELLELHHKKLQHVTRADQQLWLAAARLNECAAAAGWAALVDLAAPGQPGAMKRDGGKDAATAEQREPAPFTRLMCGDLSTEEIVDAGVSVIVHTLPHVPYWLDSPQGATTAVNLRRVVEYYSYDLLRERDLRKCWRTISATLRNIREEGVWSSELNDTISVVDAFIQRYLAFSVVPVPRTA